MIEVVSGALGERVLLMVGMGNPSDVDEVLSVRSCAYEELGKIRERNSRGVVKSSVFVLHVQRARVRRSSMVNYEPQRQQLQGFGWSCIWFPEGPSCCSEAKFDISGKEKRNQQAQKEKKQ